MNKDNGYLEQVDEFLSRPEQLWLLGAGVSYDAGIPLMIPLTDRVKELTLCSENKVLLDALFSELPERSHIEHLLSHIGDYTALALRSKSKKININNCNYEVKNLEQLHSEIIQHIANIMRWGFRPQNGNEPAAEGSYDKPIVKVQHHIDFLKALFEKRHAGLNNRRPPIRFFTTNYDTLLEDALSLCGLTYWDGFSGGAVAFRNHRYGAPDPTASYQAHVIKLHGSIDWQLSEDGKVWRVRDKDLYPDRTGRVLIYPQSTKYLATQRDPFAAQFDLLRRSLSTGADNVLAICGYSFGDEHINQEIEFALSAPTSKTTVLAFCYETDNGMPASLNEWRKSKWGKRIYVITQKGLYVGNSERYTPKDDADLEWWSFNGITNVLQNGVEGVI